MRSVTVLATAGVLVAGGRAALLAAPGQNVAPVKRTAAQLAQLNRKLASQARNEEQALARLKQQEQQLSTTVSALQQQAAAYRAQIAALEGQLQGSSPGRFGRRYREEGRGHDGG